MTAAFDPSCGLFVVNDQGDVYPSPDSLLLEADDDEVVAEHRAQVLSTYSFIGSMIGKGQRIRTLDRLHPDRHLHLHLHLHLHHPLLQSLATSTPMLTKPFPCTC